MSYRYRNISRNEVWAVFAVDLLLLLAIYLVPTISHVVGFPLYLFDPMRIAVLGSILLVNDKRNTYIMAVTLPLFSYMVAGHPILYKNLIIAIELLTNVFLFNYFAAHVKHIFSATFFSILISKLLYYALKYALVYYCLIKTALVDTNILIQLSVSVFISLFFSFVYKKQS